MKKIIVVSCFLLGIFILATLVFVFGVHEVFYSREVVEINPNISDLQVEISGLNVHYQSLGDPSDMPVIFIHGWGGSYTTRDNILSEIGRYGTYGIVLELPGMDRSSIPSVPWTNEDYADFLHQFVTHMGLEKPILIGQSFGGGVVATYAEKYPNDLRSLVLVDANTNNKPRFVKFIINLLGDTFSDFLSSSTIPLTWKKAAVAWMFVIPPELIDTGNLSIYKTMVQTFKNTHSENQLEKLARVKVPTVLIWGTFDLKTPLFWQTKQMQNLLDSSTLVTTLGGHTVIYSKPKTVVGLIMRELSLEQKSITDQEL